MKSFAKLREACWKGYKAVGNKKKGDKLVPNCVPEEVELQEEDGYPHEVHVRNYDEPDDEHSTFPKDHINYGVNIHHGTYKGATDKGYVFGFREKEHANKFVQHVNTHKHTHAEHLSSEDVFEEISQKKIDNFHKKLDKLVHHTFGKSSKEKKMKEDVKQIGEDGIAAMGPTNVVGSGKVAGLGQPPGSKSGEPPVRRKRNPIIIKMTRRSPPKM